MSAATWSRRRSLAFKRVSAAAATSAPAASWPMNVTRPSEVTFRVCGLATS